MRVNEIFYSLQGEGYYTGCAAIFVRFSGCNLRCPFCDTEFKSFVEMTEEDIVSEISQYPADLVVFTGGEPTLQLTTSLVEKVQNIGKYVAVETNGTHNVPENVDWITVSPKGKYVNNGTVTLIEADEVKIVMDDVVEYDDPTFGIKADYYYVQPCDTGDVERNKKIMDRVVNFVKDNPIWILSLQTQKILNVR